MLQLNLNPFPQLETERLLLREITKADMSELFFLRSDKRVLEFVGREPAKTLEEVETFIQKIGDAQKKNESILWGICLREEVTKVIGTICYWQLEPENYKAEIGYILNPQYWGQGLITEVIGTVVKYGFSVMQLHRIEARTHPENIASGIVLQKNEFVKEGHLAEDFFFSGKFYDTIIYARLNRS